MPLINFIPNPDFHAPQPEIKVGSVVMYGERKCVVTDTDISSRPFRLSPCSLTMPVWADKSMLKLLPERVCGWDENGPQFAPLETPPASYSWDDYPPKAGMVVEGVNARGSIKLLVGRNSFWFSLDSGGDVFFGNMTTDEMKRHYRPRPDLTWERGTP